MGGGGGLWVLKNPMQAIANPHADKKRPARRFTRMYEKVHYYSLLVNDTAYYFTDIDLDTSRGAEQVLLSNQLGHACSKITKGPLFVHKEPPR